MKATAGNLRLVGAPFEPELDQLLVAMRLHGFVVEKAEGGSVDSEGRVSVPFLKIEGGPEHATRMTDLLLLFYDHDERLFDSKLMVEDDKTVNDRLEFDFTFMGADMLVMMPPEIFPAGSQERILGRYRNELREFAEFLSKQTPA